MGKTGAGKTSLCQSLNNLAVEYKKTQAVDFYQNSIDTPGEYMESRFYKQALIMSAADADVIAFVYDCTQDEGYIPPGFGSMFPKEIIGIITKTDLVNNRDRIELAKDRLRMAGATEIFEVNTLKSEGIDKILNYLKI